MLKVIKINRFVNKDINKDIFCAIFILLKIYFKGPNLSKKSAALKIKID